MLKEFLLGNYTDVENKTGVTVVLCPNGAIGGVSVRGGAPATHETDLLRSENTVDRVSAVVLSGGSAFGLEAISGVMQYLYEKGVGFNAGQYRVPICTGASIYDLECGSFAFPDKQAGYEAASCALPITDLSGRIGAGAGATVSKMSGMTNAKPSGMAVVTAKKDALEMAVVTVVNALGDPIDPQTGKRIYCPKEETVPTFANTTISCVITNAKLSKAQANKIADSTQDAYARCIFPVHTAYDGDSIFLLSSCECDVDLLTVQMMAQELCERAIMKAVKG